MAVANPATIANLAPGTPPVVGWARGSLPQSPSPDAALGTVLSGAGSFHLPSGEFRYGVRLVRLAAIGQGAGLDVTLVHRSYFADPDGATPDTDPTGGVLSFGPGFLPSFAEAVLKDAGTGTAGAVTWVDPLGVRWSYERPVSELEPLGGGGGTMWIFPAQHGYRILAYVDAAGGTTWYREYPDHTRVEFEPVHDFAERAGSDVGYRVRRIFRGEDPASPDWQIVYAYAPGSDELVSITDSRGYLLAFAWSTLGTARRVTRLSLSHPQQGTGELAAIDLVYDDQARVQEIRYPDALVHYDPGGEGHVAQLQAYGAQGLRFTYVDAQSTRIAFVSHLLKTGSGRSAPLVEAMLQNSYDGAASWRLQSQIEAPGTPAARTHGYSYPSGQSYDVEWTDPLGVKHRIATTGTGSPVKWHVASYTRVPTAQDPSGHGEQTWSFAWDCSCGWLKSIVLPTGRVADWDYDGEGRGLITAVRLKTSAGDSNPRTWTLTYEPWGGAFDTGYTYRRASRVKTLTLENGAMWGFAFGWDSQLQEGRTDVSIPIDASTALAYSFTEDRFGRFVKREEPAHRIHFTQQTARVTTTYHYYPTPTQPGYGLVSQIDVTREAGLASQSFLYDALGRLVQYADEYGRTTTLSYDALGELEHIVLPDVSSEKPGSQTTNGAYLDFEYGPFGEVTRQRVQAVDESGNAYPKGVVTAEQAADRFGKIAERRVDAAKLEDMATSWLLSSYAYDAIGRRTQAQVPGGRELRYVWDDYDRLYQLRRRDRGDNNDPQTWPARTYAWTLEGRLSVVTDATGVQTSFVYNTHGLVEKARYGSGLYELRVFYPQPPALQLPERIEVWAQGVKIVTKRFAQRDLLGRLLRLERTDELNQGQAIAWTYVWNGLTRLERITDPAGREARHAWDKGGLLEWIEDSLQQSAGNRSEFTRDIAGLVVELQRKVQKETSPGTFQQATYRTRLVYDEWRRVRRVERFGRSSGQNPLGTRRYAYDTLSNLVWSEDGVQKVIERGYDALARLRKTTRFERNGTAQVVTAIDYDDAPGPDPYPDGLGDPLDANVLSQVITRTEARGLQTKLYADKVGRLLERRVPGYTSQGAGFSWMYRYDDEGRVLRWRDGKGHDVYVDRAADPLRRVLRRDVVPDPAGQPLSLMTGYEEWVYQDAQQKLTRRTLANAFYQQGSATKLVEETVTFDGLGRVRQEDFGFDDDGLSTPRALKSLVHGYQYGQGSDDPWFRRSLQTGSGWMFGYTLDPAGKPQEIALQGPGDPSAFTLAKYRYGGGRVFERDVRLGASKKWTRATFDRDELRYLTQLTAVYDPGGAGSGVFSLLQTRDVEGNVTEKQYTKRSGQAGDMFLLDGWDRLIDAKLGVPQSAFGQPYAQATVFDKRIEYALDLAQNRTQVTETEGSSQQTTVYQLDASSERYLDAGWGPLSYDGNGNLVFDGFRLYVYDYLDRLCEVHDWVPGTGSAVGGSGYKSSSWPKKPLRLTTAQLRELGKLFGFPGYAKTVREKGFAAYQNQLKASLDSSTSSMAQTGSDFVLVAVYGYDPLNRRVHRSVVTGDASRWQTYDGWHALGEYEDTGLAFEPRRVFLDGPGIDEHLGFSTSSDGQNWNRYIYVQDPLGHVIQVRDGDNTPIESYEYEPYGSRRIWTWTGSAWSDVPDTQIANVYGYTGRRHDPETGLLYCRNRYYEPRMGRFLTTDPLGAWHDAANWGNGYAYVANLAQSANDPLGLTCHTGCAGSANIDWASPCSQGKSLPSGQGGKGRRAKEKKWDRVHCFNNCVMTAFYLRFGSNQTSFWLGVYWEGIEHLVFAAAGESLSHAGEDIQEQLRDIFINNVAGIICAYGIASADIAKIPDKCAKFCEKLQGVIY